MIKRSSHLALASLVVATHVGMVPPAFSQPALERTPNLEGTANTPSGMLLFSVLHRFQIGAAPTYTVTNLPTLDLSTGWGEWASWGAMYATETQTVPGASQELELYAKQRFWDESEGAPLSVSLREAFNVTALSPDVELSGQRSLGPLGIIATLRAMGNYRYSGTPQLTVGLGTSYMITRAIALQGDAAVGWPQAGPGGAVVWGAGLAFQVPSSPHTLSLHATNASTSTTQGASTATAAVRYGFDFTIPFSGAAGWLAMFKPAADKQKEAGAPAPQAAKAFFTSRCASCHGEAGQGGFAPDLRAVETKGDDFIRERIREGSPKGMPPFESELTPSELEALVQYVKSL